MSHAELDVLGEELRTACKQKGVKGFAVELAYQVGTELHTDRARKLTAIASPEASTGEPYDLLLLFDVVAATASLEAAGVETPHSGAPVASDVIDLWIRATAGRSLWYERFVQWPQENSAKKLEHLLDTARKLGAESIARGLIEGMQAVQFTEFVGRFSKA